MANTLKDRVLARLGDLELGPVEAATKGGLDRYFIRDITVGKKQTVTVRLMPRLAAALNTTAAYLTGEVDNPEVPDTQTPPQVVESLRSLISIPRAGRVEAGEFREVSDFKDLEREFLLDEVDPDFPRARMMAFDVIGDSMDRADPPIPPGSTIICVDFEDTNLPHIEGDIVVVERTRNGGLTREWSVKEIVTFSDRTEFHPRSSNPRHEPIVMWDRPHADDGVQIRVLALVRRISTPVARSKSLRR